MNKKEITINEISYPVSFNIGTMLSFEEIAEKPFLGETFERTRDRAALVLSAIISADGESDINLQTLIKDTQWEEFNDAFTSIMEMATDFFRVPKTLTDNTAPDGSAVGDEKEEPAKN